MQLINRIPVYILFLVLASVFLFPGIQIKSLPAIRIEDIFFLPVLIYVCTKFKQISWNYPLVLSVFTGFILLSIFVNFENNRLRDYFEIYKLVKFGTYVLFFSLVASKDDCVSFLNWIFASLVVFNLFQYFNWLGFNQIVEPFYSAEIHLSKFGLNSQFQADTKRLLGTMGNPNNNAILFLFFSCLYSIFRAEKKIIYNIFYYISFAFLIACQSRTGVIAFAVITVAEIILLKVNIKEIVINAFILLVIYLFFFIGGDAETPKYLNNTINSEVTKSNSVTSRMHTWKLLWNMILKKPFLGYGPYKTYFYENSIYSENQYMLIIWRYGFAGFLAFLTAILFPLINIVRSGILKKHTPFILFYCVILVTSFTNNPINEPRILLMFAFMLGTYASEVFLLNNPHEKAVAGR